LYTVEKVVRGRRNLDWLDVETQLFKKFRDAHYDIVPIERPD
jgi:hypothetical protein